MSWTNVALINTKEGWQYTQSFVGDYVRIRHLLGVAQEDLPYGFTGLLAQAFDFENTVELYNIRKLYPFNQEDIFSVINPLTERTRRLAVRGQKRYQTKISWQVVIDVWNGTQPVDDLNTRLASLEIKLDALVSSNSNLNYILNQILTVVGVPQTALTASISIDTYYPLQLLGVV